jgi:protein TonB
MLRPSLRYLLSGVVISLAVHVIVLAIRFTPTPPAKPPKRDAGLEVVLLNAGTRSAPSHARLLAQVNSNGGGNADAGHSRAPTPRSAESHDGKLLSELRQQQAALEAQQRLLADKVTQARVAAAKVQGQHAANQTGADEQVDKLQRQFAEISQRIEDYNKRPRMHFVAPATAEYRFAAYVDEWRRRIETLGTQNYPEAARGKVYGSLRMTVYIRRDGGLEGVDIDQPSEHKILNDAARRIVALAAPFAPFPPQIARDTDVLAITRTWYFTHDKLIAKPG